MLLGIDLREDRIIRLAFPEHAIYLTEPSGGRVIREVR